MYAKLPINILAALACALLVMGATLTHAQAQLPPCPPGVQPGPGSNCRNPDAPTPTGNLQRDGVFGCSASKYQNPGSTVALGGAYVPVNDAAVTLNTGYLVYKECVLDGVVSSIKNSAVTGLQHQTISAVKTSRDGNPQFLRNRREDLAPYFDALVVSRLQGQALAPLCGAFQNTVKTARARNYFLGTRSATQSFSCPFGGSASDQQAFFNGKSFTFDMWNSAIQPSGNPLGADLAVNAWLSSEMNAYDRNISDMLNYGNGFFPAFDSTQDPLGQRVLTPGFIIANSLQKMISVGTDILVNANEIDQINGALQAGLQTTIVTDTIRGLSGLSSSQNGQPSYLDRMNAEAQAGVRASAVNAALSILAVVRQTESIYKNAKEAVATALTNAINKLRAAENTCWGLIVPKVQAKATADGATLRIATSTEFSQRVIDTQIGPLAAATINDLRVSEQALALINQLIASVTNSSSAANQRAALERLDSMVANNQLHTAQEAQNAQRQKDEIVTSLAALIEDTLKSWGDSTNPEVGWCNVNSQATIDMWFNRWKQ